MHNRQNNKESRTYVQGLRSFNKTLPRGIKGILKKNGYNYSEIISKWNSLVGKDISSCAYPKSIKMKKKDKDGTLILNVNRGDEINIEYSKNEIMNKINSFFGYQLIKEIKLEKVNPKNLLKKNRKSKNLFIKEKQFKYKIKKVKNEDIKNSLLELMYEMKNGKT